MPRPARPGAHGALLEAARDEFARRGLERARVEDIARRAGVSKGAFYLHFRTKEDAFREIVQRFLAVLEDLALRRHDAEDRIARELADHPAAWVRRMDAECAMDTELLEVLWRHRQILSAVEGASGRRYRAILQEFRGRMRALLARRIVDRQRAGALRREVDADVVADMVLGTYEDIARRMIDMKTKPDLAGWARSILLVLYEGILAQPAASHEPRAVTRGS